jgi:hypothetical protein
LGHKEAHKGTKVKAIADPHCHRYALRMKSLPDVLWDEDEGIAEALRRDADLDQNPDQAISLELLDQQIKSRRLAVKN